MTKVEIHAGDNFLTELNFKPYQSREKRLATQFNPIVGEPQYCELETPWGETLVVKKGDYIVSDMENPVDKWPVDKDIFEETYIEVSPGHYIKKALIFLAPLIEFTKDPDQLVTIDTLEGEVTVRSGDFYLARGIKGEIWPYPLSKALTSLKRIDFEPVPNYHKL